jgi:hypothetical protein
MSVDGRNPFRAENPPGLEIGLSGDFGRKVAVFPPIFGPPNSLPFPRTPGMIPRHPGFSARELDDILRGY